MRGQAVSGLREPRDAGSHRLGGSSRALLLMEYLVTSARIQQRLLGLSPRVRHLQWRLTEVTAKCSATPVGQCGQPAGQEHRTSGLVVKRTSGPGFVRVHTSFNKNLGNAGRHCHISSQPISSGEKNLQTVARKELIDERISQEEPHYGEEAHPPLTGLVLQVTGEVRKSLEK